MPSMSFSMAAATILATDPTPICTTTEPGLIGTITDWLIMLMETIGGIGVALAIALESIFPPSRPKSSFRSPASPPHAAP